MKKIFLSFLSIFVLWTVLVNSKTIINAFPNEGDVSYSIDGLKLTANYGTQVTLSAAYQEGKQFLFWLEDGKLISKSPNYNVTIYGNQVFSSIYKDNNTVIIFLDANNDYLGMSGLDPITIPPSPNKPGYQFNGWDIPSEILEDTYLIASYTPKAKIELVSAGPASLSYLLDDVKLALIGKATCENQIVEYGVVYSRLGDPNDNVGSYSKRAAIATENNEYSINMPILKDSYVYARSYIVVNISGNYMVEYSDLASIYNGYYITYNMGPDGHMATKEEVVSDFINDISKYFNKSITASDFFNSTYGLDIYSFFLSDSYGRKWEWLENYIIAIATDSQYSGLSYLKNKDASYWRSNLWSFCNNSVKIDYPISIDFTIYSNAHGFWNKSPYSYYEEMFIPGSSLFDNVYSSKIGYQFVGWIDGEQKPVDSLSTLSSNIELTATYSPIDYQINYMDVVNTEHENPNSYTINDEIILQDAYREGKIFKGWFSEANGGGLKVDKITQGSFGNITLYAYFADDQLAQDIETLDNLLMVANVPTHINSNQLLPTVDNQIKWSYKNGEDTSLYDIATGVWNPGSMISGQRKIIASYGLASKEIDIDFSVVGNSTAKFNSNSTYVATDSNWSGYTLEYTDSTTTYVYFIKNTFVKNITVNDINTSNQVVTLFHTPIPDGKTTDKEGYLYVNNTNVSVTIRLGNTKWYNNSAYGAIAINNSGNTAYFYNLVSIDTVVTIEPGCVFWVGGENTYNAGWKALPSFKYFEPGKINTTNMLFKKWK